MPLTGVYGNPDIYTKRVNRISSGKNVITMKFISPNTQIPLYSNFKIELPNYHHLEPDMLHEVCEQPIRKRIIIDEAYAWLEARLSSTNEINEYFSYMLFQSRKNNEDWWMIAQQRDTIDKRFRKGENYMILCKDRDIWLSDGSINNIDDFYYVAIKGSKVKPITLKYRDAEKYFTMYNTGQKIKPLNMQQLQYKLDKKNPEKLNKNIDELTEKILKEIPYEYKNITMYMVKDAFVRLSLPTDYISYVYARIKSKI